MKRTTRLVALLTLSLVAAAGCSTQQQATGSTAAAPASGAEGSAAPAAAPDTRPCIVNYTTEGNFWKGKLYRTFELFPRVSKANAFDLIATDITVKGGQINAIDKELGLISASATVTGGEGATVPINASVKEAPGGGSRVELSFRTSTGQVAIGSVAEAFCKALQVVEAAQPPAATPATAKKKAKK